MANVHKHANEDWLPFYRRRHQCAQAFRTGEDLSLWHAAVCAGHGWQGHVRRHPDSPPARADAWRNLAWWRTVQHIRHPTDPAGRHPRKGWSRGAEVCLMKCLGPDFAAMAADRMAWAAARGIFL